MKKKLIVFDFDGTLFDSPTPEQGKFEYKIKTGKDYPHIGWWSKPETLDSEIFNIQPIPFTIGEYHKHTPDSTNHIIMMTGRLPRLSHLVEALLTKHELKFHEYHYNNGGSTHVCKMKTIGKILEKMESIDEIIMYDDRDDHVPIFREFGSGLVKDGRLKKFEVIHVKQ